MKSPARQMPGAPPPLPPAEAPWPRGPVLSLRSRSRQLPAEGPGGGPRRNVSGIFYKAYNLLLFHWGHPTIIRLRALFLYAISGHMEKGGRPSSNPPPLVRAVGLEPTRTAPQEPKSCTSTNSAIPAYSISLYFLHGKGMPEAEHPSWSAFIKSVGTCSCRIRLK